MMLLTLSGIAAAAQDAPLALEGTIWRVVDSDCDNYVYEFRQGGILHYTSPRGYFQNGTWKQDGASVYVETNKKFQERNGTLNKDGIDGAGKNIKGQTWTWTASRSG
jgi:hypothetical protein